MKLPWWPDPECKKSHFSLELPALAIQNSFYAFAKMKNKNCRRHFAPWSTLEVIKKHFMMSERAVFRCCWMQLVWLCHLRRGKLSFSVIPSFSCRLVLRLCHQNVDVAWVRRETFLLFFREATRLLHRKLFGLLHFPAVENLYFSETRGNYILVTAYYDFNLCLFRTRVLQNTRQHFVAYKTSDVFTKRILVIITRFVIDR